MDNPVDGLTELRFTQNQPMNYFNQHSFTAIATIVLIVIAIVLMRDGIRFLDVVSLAAIASVFGVSWLLLRPGQSTLTEADAVETVLTSGDPTLIEFQSEY